MILIYTHKILINYKKNDSDKNLIFIIKSGEEKHTKIKNLKKNEKEEYFKNEKFYFKTFSKIEFYLTIEKKNGTFKNFGNCVLHKKDFFDIDSKGKFFVLNFRDDFFSNKKIFFSIYFFGSTLKKNIYDIKNIIDNRHLGQQAHNKQIIKSEQKSDDNNDHYLDNKEEHILDKTTKHHKLMENNNKYLEKIKVKLKDKLKDKLKEKRKVTPKVIEKTKNKYEKNENQEINSADFYSEEINLNNKKNNNKEIENDSVSYYSDEGELNNKNNKNKDIENESVSYYSDEGELNNYKNENKDIENDSVSYYSQEGELNNIKNVLQTMSEKSIIKIEEVNRTIDNKNNICSDYEMVELYNKLLKDKLISLKKKTLKVERRNIFEMPLFIFQKKNDFFTQNDNEKIDLIIQNEKEKNDLEIQNQNKKKFIFNFNNLKDKFFGKEIENFPKDLLEIKKRIEIEENYFFISKITKRLLEQKDNFLLCFLKTAPKIEKILKDKKEEEILENNNNLNKEISSNTNQENNEKEKLFFIEKDQYEQLLDTNKKFSEHLKKSLKENIEKTKQIMNLKNLIKSYEEKIKKQEEENMKRILTLKDIKEDNEKNEKSFIDNKIDKKPENIETNEKNVIKKEKIDSNLLKKNEEGKKKEDENFSINTFKKKEERKISANQYQTYIIYKKQKKIRINKKEKLYSFLFSKQKYFLDKIIQTDSNQNKETEKIKNDYNDFILKNNNSEREIKNLETENFNLKIRFFKDKISKLENKLQNLEQELQKNELEKSNLKKKDEERNILINKTQEVYQEEKKLFKNILEKFQDKLNYFLSEFCIKNSKLNFVINELISINNFEMIENIEKVVLNQNDLEFQKQNLFKEEDPNFILNIQRFLDSPKNIDIDDQIK